MHHNYYDLIVMGGGAAGFFAAITAKKQLSNHLVLLLEKSSTLLGKVRISGGGRCNVTHHCFDPRQLVQNYPRGSKALLGPFTRFQPSDTVQWFSERGVELKTESDGRMFPITDNSQTIIDCLLQEATKLGVEIAIKTTVVQIGKEGEHFVLQLSNGQQLKCQCLLLATGSHPQGYQFARQLGHTIREPVPSLFTFNVPSSPLKDLAGVSVNMAEVQLEKTSFKQQGPLLITHWGFSGPAVLKLSAWGARFFHEQHYKANCIINWLPHLSFSQLVENLSIFRQQHPLQAIATSNPFDLPKSLWKRLLELTAIDTKRKLSEISNLVFSKLAQRLHADIYQVDGKTTHKEEFVTCGGVTLDEVNFKTMESRLCPGLHFAGEIIDVDGVTGGFNFQNAWTTGWLAGQGFSEKILAKT